ncbi:hypothetical protein, partial [Salmonella enterica]|uniref:hypothetical protein n=1 Tax=Salmonella enterica TaxID=28901 RepID=UPI003D2AC036
EVRVEEADNEGENLVPVDVDGEDFDGGESESDDEDEEDDESPVEIPQLRTRGNNCPSLFSSNLRLSV